MSIVCATERSRELIKRIALICLLITAVKCLQDDEWKAEYNSYSYISPIIKEADVSKPQNLTCTLQSAYMIYVTWDPPLVGIPKFYDIQWTWPDGYENPTPTIKTEYNMTDLIPCTQYAINVRSGDGTSESNPAEVKCETHPPSVSPPPTDVQITNLAPDNATLTWTVPTTRCLFVNYSITWEFESLWGEGQASGDGEYFTNSGKKRYIINDLAPYSNVTACVSAALSNTDFGKPSCASGITLPDSPGRPENMKHGNIAQCKVNVTWSEPTEINGILGSWILSLNIEDEEVLNVILPPETRSYELLDLLHDTDYNVTLQASTEAGFGDAAFCIIRTPALVDDDPNLAAIIGGTVGVLLGIVIIVGAVFFGRKWKARKAESKHNEIRTESQMTHTPEGGI